MNISEFAWQILESSSLDAKLAHGEVKDFSFSETQLPDQNFYPARSVEISFSSSRSTKWRLPVRRELELEAPRGELLHFFANHELLAIEVMAFAILKWGAKDPRFCRDTYRILIQEQEHFKLYQQRMVQLGVEFGQMPRNDFFWRVLLGLEHRSQYLAVMPLTFEQANLDYAKHYQKIFSEISDHDSAQIMERVYREEIGHVAHGVRYLLERSKDDQEDKQWQTYLENLPPHISPTRAVGLGFDETSRQKAGLNQRYCDLLRTFGRSFGKPGSLWFYDPDFETSLWQNSSQQVSRRQDQSMHQSMHQSIQNDFSFLLSYLAKAHDVVTVPEQPDLKFLTELRSLGIELPFYMKSSDLKESVHEMRHPHANISKLSPWSARSQDLKLGAMQKELSAKATAWEINRTCIPALKEVGLPIVGIDDIGRVVKNLAELETYLESCSFPILLKENFNSAGRGNRVLWDRSGLNSNIEAWLNKVWKRSGSVFVQRFFPKRWDLSLFLKPGQLQRRHGHEYRLLQAALTQSSGAYLGQGLGSGFPLLPKVVMQNLLTQSKQAFSQVMKTLVQKVLDEIQARFPDWEGPLGLDLMVVWDENEDRAKIFPLLEINPRWTMGSIANSLEFLVASKHCALFSLIQKGKLKEGVCQNGNSLDVQTIAQSNVKKINEGYLFLTDPQRAQNFQAVLHVAKDMDSLRAKVRSTIQDQDDRRLQILAAYS